MTGGFRVNSRSPGEEVVAIIQVRHHGGWTGMIDVRH